MKIRFPFEARVLLFLLLTSAIVISSGILAYRSLSNLASIVSSSANPEIRLVLLKGVTADLNSAESNIRSYSLTLDRDYLLAYENALDALEDKVGLLDSLTANNAVQHGKLDSIITLIQLKLFNLDELSKLQNRGSVTNELNILSKKIDERKKIAAKSETVAPAADKPAETVEQPKKKGFFKRIFSKKKEESPEQIKQEEARIKKNIRESQREKEIRMLEEMKKEVRAAKEKQVNKLRTLDTKELLISQQSKGLSDQISAIITDMEVTEINTSRRLVLEQEKRQKDTGQLITIFSITASGLLLGMTWIIIGYLRKKKFYEQGLLQAKTEAENYSAMQEIFLANMSHEIRTPMNAIYGFTEQLLQSTFMQAQREQLGIIKKSAEHLLVVINDILDYSKLKAGKLLIDNIGFIPKEVLDEVLHMLRPQAEKNKVELSCYLSEDIPEIVTGDPVRLRQILLNIIGNAVKFTKHGQVSVVVQSLDQDANRLKLEILVEDSGIGISPENLQRIFHAFEQADGSTTRKYGGSGLGLAITRKLIDILGGEISMQSQEGKGTVVRIILPYTTGSINPQKVSTDQEKVHAVLKGKKILVADDEEWNIKLLQAILHRFEVELFQVSDGHEAMDIFEKETLDLVLLDMRMPGMSGLEVAENIRSHHDTPKSFVPIVILSAAAENKEITESKVRVNAVVSKPFTEQKFLEALVNILSSSPHTSHYYIEAFSHTAESIEKTSSYNLFHLKKLSNKDQKFMKDMIDTFIRNLRHTIGKLKMYVHEQHWEGISGLAHKISAPCRFLEINALVDIFRQTEQAAVEKNSSRLADLIKEAEQEAERVISGLEKEIYFNA